MGNRYDRCNCFSYSYSYSYSYTDREEGNRTSVRPKKVIPPIKRPGLYEFGIAFDPDYVWKDGVYICQHGRKQLYFSCELPLCQNFDLIEVYSLYMTEAGLVRVQSMYLNDCIAQHYYYVVINEEGHKEKLMTWEFLSAYW